MFSQASSNVFAGKLARAVALLCGLVCAAAAADLPVGGGADPGAAPAGVPPESRSQFFDPEDGQLDISHFLEHPWGFVPIPIIVTEPAVGYGGGLAGMFLRPRENAGQEGWTRPNISAVGGIATENGTWAAFAADSSRWLDGRLHTTTGVGTGVRLRTGLSVDRAFDWFMPARQNFARRSQRLLL